MWSETTLIWALTSSGSMFRTSATKLSSSSGRFPSRASLRASSFIVSPMVRSPPSSPTYRDTAFTSGSASYTPRRKRCATCQALGGRPSGPRSSSSTAFMWLDDSMAQARTRSWGALSRLTRPISRRYMRTGSSIISAVSSPWAQAFCASVSGFALPSASTEASSWTDDSLSGGLEPNSSSSPSERRSGVRPMMSAAVSVLLGKPVYRSSRSARVDRVAISCYIPLLWANDSLSPALTPATESSTSLTGGTVLSSVARRTT